MKRIAMIVTMATTLACADYPYTPCFLLPPDACGGETGGEDGLYCGPPDATGRWRCVLNDANDLRVEKAIADGLLVPWTDQGTCPHRGREWDTLRRVDPVNNGATPLRAAECSDTPIPKLLYFSICLPDQAVWSSGKPNGAIGPIDDDEWSPNCTALDPYAVIYEYLYATPCAGGVTCLGFDDECACKCDDDSDCGLMQDWLEAQYFGEDQDGLIPGGWESACTGYPWVWDQYAYGSGSYVGTSCEWNMPGPKPGEVPQPLQDVIDEITCVRSTCTIGEHVLDDLIASPGLIAGSSTLALGRVAIEIGQCNHVCAVLGLRAGDKILAIGRRARDPTDLSAWAQAYDELLTGRTEATIATRTHSYVLTLVLEN